MFIIDHLAQHSVSDADGRNELNTLSVLGSGIHSIVQTVESYEQAIRSHLGTAAKSSGFYGFGMPGLPPSAESLLPCLFHWYGITICNYARLVGFLSGISSGVYTRSATEDSSNYKLIKEHCDNYVSSIPELEPVKIWRNKVFAHFALTDPRANDNAALLDVSTMSPTSFLGGRFHVGGVTIACRGAAISMPAWSITETYEQLSSRFWRAPD